MKRVFTKGVISSIAAALPKNKKSIKDFADIYGEKIVARISKATGIDEIHVAPQNATTADYCVEAAKHLFEKGICPVSSVDGIVFVSQTPDYLIPHTSAVIQQRLGVPNSAIAMDLNFGCAGYVYGLFQAMMLVETGYCKKVLLCAGDTLSRYIHPLDRALRMVMGDAGTATIVSATNNDSSSAFSFFTDGEGSSLLQIPAGGNRMQRRTGETDLLLEDADGNKRTQENLYMDGTAIMAFALERVPQVISEVLSTINWAKEEVNLFALHQANAFMVKYIAKTMKVAKEKAPVNVRLTGNTSSASIPLMLCNLYAGQNEDLKKVICCGFGTGLACAAGALDLSQADICSPVDI